jgi:hypothetical protein
MRKVVRRKRAYQLDDTLHALGNAPGDARRRVIRSEIDYARDLNAENRPDEAYVQGRRLRRLDQHMRGRMKPVYFT